MVEAEILRDTALILLCYAYTLLIILSSNNVQRLFHISVKTSRKFVHMMIGNLPLVIPFFTSNIAPVLVAAPFVLVTLCVSPYSPFPFIAKKLSGLAGITEEGHKLGLVFYAVSYTVLALVFASRPYVIAAGVMPMAYGDAVASIVGERFGKTRPRHFSKKSLEGSLAMFLASFLSLSFCLIFFSFLYSFILFDAILAALVAATVASLVEFVSPSGSDNLTVPLSGVITFVALLGGF